MTFDFDGGAPKSRSYTFSLPWEVGGTMELYLQKMQIRRVDFLRDAVYEKLERSGVPCR